ncbi:MAG: FlgD immunoglobulin-like domain containing protein [Candidatus Latescibacterota bacterium]
MPPSTRLCRSLLVSAGLCLLWTSSGVALQTVTVGQGGQLDWHGVGSAPVAALDPEQRSPLDPNKLTVTNTPGDLIELDAPGYAGAMLPLRIQDGENIAPGTMLRGGDIDAPNVFDFGWQVGVASTGIFDRNDLRLALQELLTTEDGGEQRAFERKNYNALGTLVLFDLGGRFGVNRIRFYPRNTVRPSPATPYQSDYLKAFELYINDGVKMTREGAPIWESVRLETDNQNPVVDVPLDPPRYVQSVRLRATTTVDFEIDEIEVYGVGYLATAQYVSDIFDAGQPAIWGRLRWLEEAIGNPALSGLQIRTRTGSDATPYVFTRVLGGKRDAEEIPFSLGDPTEEMGLAEYQSLPQTDSQDRNWEPGPVKDDLVNWSPFSTAYPQSAAGDPGVQILSPSPRRYFQFHVSFQSSALDAARALRQVSFDLLSPALADEVVGEVYPREAKLSAATSFTYVVRPAIKTPGLRGFDVLEVATPVRVEQVESVEVLDQSGRTTAQESFSAGQASGTGSVRILSVADDLFAVSFPRVAQDSTVVRVRFRTQVLSYSTSFAAVVRLTEEPGIAQTISPGDAATLGEDDDPDLSGTTVLSPSVLRNTRLLSQVEPVPAVFSPNADGINDATVVHYSLLSLDAPRPVGVRIYDLGGRLVRRVQEGARVNGRYADGVWDGRDDQGQLVPPGLYIVQVSAEGDAHQEEQARTVGVAY